MKMTVISIVIGAIGSVPKSLARRLEELEMGERAETIQTTELLKSVRILSRVLETWGYLMSPSHQWKALRQRWWRKLTGSNITISGRSSPKRSKNPKKHLRYSNNATQQRTPGRMKMFKMRVRTPVALLRSLSGKYPWEWYEPPYPPRYGLNSTTTVLLGE